VNQYTLLITSEHASRPRFVATVELSTDPFVTLQALYASMPALFDIDAAAGQQLDIDGEWVGRSRKLLEPLTGVYFAFDTTGLGFDQGMWRGPDDPSEGLIVLDDPTYRLLLLARILVDQWDGTADGMREAWQALMGPLGYTVLLQDACDMTCSLALTGAPRFDPFALSLFATNVLAIKPDGVRINNFWIPSVPWPTPFFGFDVENSAVSGFDVGAWAFAAQPPVIPPPRPLLGITFVLAESTLGL